MSGLIQRHHGLLIPPRDPAFVIDSFTDTDGTALLSHTGELTGTYIRNTSTGSAAAEVSATNTLFWTVAGIFHPAKTASSPNYYGEAMLDQKAATTSNSLFVGLRYATGQNSGYVGGFTATGSGTGNWTLGRFDNASFTSYLTLAMTIGISDGQYFRVLIDGTWLLLYANGTIALAYNTAPDATKYSTPGSVAIRSSMTGTDATSTHLNSIKFGYA